MSKELFNKLSSVNVNSNTEKKNGMTYLSWAFAMDEFSKNTDGFTYNIHMFEDEKCNQLPYMYDEKTGYMVMTSITVDKDTKTMWLPVMDFKNQAKMNASMTDINKSIMRCLVKNMAMFGLGLYIYAGEDLPSLDNRTPAKAVVAPSVVPAAVKDAFPEAVVVPQTEADFTKAILATTSVEGLNELYSQWKHFEVSKAPAYTRLLKLTKETKAKL